MSHGIFPVGRVDVGALSGLPAGITADNFRRQSGATVGTAGIQLGTAAKQGRLYRLRVVNGAATAYFLQIHDKASAPTNGNVPVYVVRLASSGDVEINMADVAGLPLTLGMTFAISSTAATLTLAVANDIAHYAATFTQQA